MFLFFVSAILTSIKISGRSAIGLLLSVLFLAQKIFITPCENTTAAATSRIPEDVLSRVSVIVIQHGCDFLRR